MDIETLFRHKAFAQLEASQVQLLKQFARDIQGKPAPEVARLYMQVNQKITQIKPISPAQRSAIIDAVRSFLPASEQQKLNGFIKMMGR